MNRPVHCFSFPLWLLLVSASVFLSAHFAAADYPYGHFYYTRQDGEITITGVVPGITAASIPPSINGYPVTAIGEYAFEECTKLKSVSIPNSVTTIMQGAFYGCTALTSITIPTSVEYIDCYNFEDGDGPFAGCKSLKSIVVAAGNEYYRVIDGVLYDSESTLVAAPPAGVSGTFTVPGFVRNIGAGAFEGCTKIKSIVLPRRLEAIGAFAFCDCTGLASIDYIDLEEGGLNDGVFWGCKALKSITVSPGCWYMYDTAFRGCTGLKSITFFGGEPEIWENEFGEGVRFSSKVIVKGYESNGWYDGEFFGGATVKTLPVDVEYEYDDDGILITGPVNANATSITIPPMLDGELTHVGDSAFRRMPKLKSATIATGRIGWGAFAVCPSLTTVNLLSCDSIDGTAFFSCEKLTTISPIRCEVGDSAFYGCSSLKAVSFIHEWNDIWIGGDAFANCVKLKTLDLGGGNDACGFGIAEYAFADCSSLNSVHLPANVSYIGEGAFSYCKSLKSITVDPENENYSAFGNVLYNGEGTELLCVPGAFTGTLEVRRDVVSIKQYAAADCTKLKALVLPSSLETIGESAFEDCTALTTVTIPWGGDLTTISDSAFAGCKKLKSFPLSAGVVEIGVDAFGGCAALASLSIPATVEVIGGGAFAGCTGMKSLTVSSGNQTYKATGNVLFSKDGTSLISMAGSPAGTFTVPVGVTTICEGAFWDCSKLKSIVLSPTVERIEDDAFKNCSSLATINLPETVRSLGEDAFAGCVNLSQIRIPDGITVIEDETFYNCKKLSQVILPDTIECIGAYAFEGCTSLVEILLPYSITSIETGAFYNCTKLTSVILPEYLESIGSYAFYNCKALASLALPASLTTIGADAFYGCAKLSSIVIPASVEYLGWGAFDKCTKLLDIYFLGDEEMDYAWSVLQNKTKVHASWYGYFGETAKGVPIPVTHFEYDGWELEIDGPEYIACGDKVRYDAILDGEYAVTPTWSIAYGGKYAKIDKNGLLTVGKTASVEPIVIRAVYPVDGCPVTALYTVYFDGLYGSPKTLKADAVSRGTASTGSGRGFTVNWRTADGEEHSLHVVGSAAEAAFLATAEPDCEVALLSEMPWSIDILPGTTIHSSESALQVILPDGATAAADGFVSTDASSLLLALP